MDPAIQTALDALTAQNAALATQLAALQAAAAAPAAAGPLSAAAIGAAIAANLHPAPPPASDHSKDLYRFNPSSWSSEETGDAYLHVTDFIKNLESRWSLKGTPDAPIRVQLCVELLMGKAMIAFKAFVNAAGNLGCRDTTTWTEWRAWALATLQPDVLVESEKIESSYERLEQKGSAEKFVDAYKLLVSRIRLNSESAALHTEASLIKTFVRKLKPGVRIHMVDRKFTSLEQAYSEASRRDAIVYEASKGAPLTSAASAKPPYSGARGGSPFTPRGGSPFTPRGGSPGLPFQGPPAHIAALLGSLGFNWDGTPMQGAPKSPATTPPPRLGAVERNHAVGPNDPVPSMTPDIKAWCFKNQACFRCRQPLAGTHLNGHCPRFGPPSSRPRRVAALEVFEEDLPENE
jgi:hypothetical protein